MISLSVLLFFIKDFAFIQLSTFKGFRIVFTFLKLLLLLPYSDFPGNNILGYKDLKFKTVTSLFKLIWLTRDSWKSAIPPLRGGKGPTVTIFNRLLNYFFDIISIFIFFINN